MNRSFMVHGRFNSIITWQKNRDRHIGCHFLRLHVAKSGMFGCQPDKHGFNDSSANFDFCGDVNHNFTIGKSGNMCWYPDGSMRSC